MDEDMFRVIPGYEKYGVTKGGVVVSFERDLILSEYVLNGYRIVDTFRGSLTETLPVHRAVALAWVDNPSPDLFTVVNHIDGNPSNNWWTNLEWTDHSGNNYHAVNTGLRVDNIQCKVRDFNTRIVHDFNSMAQAAAFMGMSKDTSVYRLCPKMFGKLIMNRYEFRFNDDPTPWFYESRIARIQPSRYMVVVRNSDNSVREIYSTKTLLKDYQLYGCQGRSIPELAKYGNELFPEKEFTVHDSYTEQKFRVTRRTKKSDTVPISAKSLDETLDFTSLTQCANHFNVDRSSVINRLNNGKDLDGWTFSSNATLASNG